MKAIIFGFVVLFLIAICQPSNGAPKVYQTQRARRSPEDNQAKIYVEKHSRRDPTLNADLSHQWESGNHRVSTNAGVNSPDLRHFNPGANVNYEYRPQKHVVFSTKTGVGKSPSGNFEGQVHAGVGIDW